MLRSASRSGALHSLLLLGAAIAICGSSEASAQSAPMGGLRPLHAVLDARLYPPDVDALHFVLAESSYVAVFELAPGRGIRLVHPADDGRPEQRLQAGWHTLPRPTADPLATEPASRLGTAEGARFFYLVASRQPLGVPAGRRSPAALASALGLLDFRSTDPLAQAASITKHALTLGADHDWVDTPLVNAAPGSLDPLARVATDTVSVRCPDGRVYRVTNDRSGRPFECPR